jgi:hypothetical protein
MIAIKLIINVQSVVMKMTIKKLTEEQFEEQYELIDNHIDDNAAFDGKMFETFGEELKFVFEMSKENRVITIIESDDNCEDCDEDEVECIPDMFYVSGMHLVNRLGFLVTSEPILENFEVKINW